MPPLFIESLSHPQSDKVYNDDFSSLQLTWQKPFASATGYYVRLDSKANLPPGPSSGIFVAPEKTEFLPTNVVDGDNFFHIASVDAASQVGAVETVRRVRINTKGPTMSSTSHPRQDLWSAEASAYFSWAFPQGDASVKGVYYALDHYGSTVPTTAAAFLPVTQKQILQSALAPGVWVLHVVSVDLAGRLTKAAGHYRVNIGPDPGTGGASGHVVDATSQPVRGATVTVNRGLYTQTTDSNGNYSFPAVPVGTWEISVESAGRKASKNVTITKGAIEPADLSL